jgi:hypothetical protein
MARDDEIKVIAYHIWQEEDCCHGHAAEDWLKAETIWEEKQKLKTGFNNPPVQLKPVSKTPVKPVNKTSQRAKKSRPSS